MKSHKTLNLSMSLSKKKKERSITITDDSIGVIPTIPENGKFTNVKEDTFSSDKISTNELSSMNNSKTHKTLREFTQITCKIKTWQIKHTSDLSFARNMNCNNKINQHLSCGM